MIFSTYKFILIFLPIVFGGYYALLKLKLDKLAKIFLIVASLAFYGFGSWEFFPFFLMSIFGNYIFGTTLAKLGESDRVQKKAVLVVGLLANIGLLGYYKYTDFFIENVNFFTGKEIPLMNIVLPIGISFFTFQLIAYLVDSYRGGTKEYDIISYLLFITFFPQLIVGPIIHHAEVVPQFEDKENQRIKMENIAKGLFLFSIGCAKKILLADLLTTEAESFFYGDLISNMYVPDFFDAWFYSIEYTISYYFDLSGYADMAIGLGFLFNIKIPRNFNSPYKARNFQDYWRRWHMTLSRFLGDYIFRGVYKKNCKYRNYYIATMATFFVSGFWHGAGWTFIAWGVINGFFVCTASWMKRKGWSFWAPVSYALTALGVIATRVLFVSDSFSNALLVYKGMLNVGSIDFSNLFQQIISFIMSHEIDGSVLFVGTIICWFMPNSGEMADRFKLTKKTAIFAAVLLAVSLMNMNKVVSFLYFQF